MILLLGISIGLLLTVGFSSMEDKREVEQNTVNDFFCDPLIKKA